MYDMFSVVCVCVCCDFNEHLWNYASFKHRKQTLNLNSSGLKHQLLEVYLLDVCETDDH